MASGIWWHAGAGAGAGAGGERGGGGEDADEGSRRERAGGGVGAGEGSLERLELALGRALALACAAWGSRCWAAARGEAGAEAQLAAVEAVRREVLALAARARGAAAAPPDERAFVLLDIEVGLHIGSPVLERWAAALHCGEGRAAVSGPALWCWLFLGEDDVRARRAPLERLPLAAAPGI